MARSPGFRVILPRALPSLAQRAKPVALPEIVAGYRGGGRVGIAPTSRVSAEGNKVATFPEHDHARDAGRERAPRAPGAGYSENDGCALALREEGRKVGPWVECDEHCFAGDRLHPRSCRGDMHPPVRRAVDDDA